MLIPRVLSTRSRGNRLDGRGHAAKPFEVQALRKHCCSQVGMSLLLLLSESWKLIGASGSSSKEGMHSYLIC